MRLQALGRPRITVDDIEVKLQPLPLTLLVYLTVDGPRDRTHLAQLFWSQTGNSLNSLSSSLNRIRAVLPDAVWTRGPNEVGSNLQSDVADILAATERGDVGQVGSLYHAPFLSGLELRRYSGEFEDWMLDQRTSLAATVERALLTHGSALLEADRHAEGASVAERAWRIATRDGIPSPDLFVTYHQMLAQAANPTVNDVRAMAEDFGIDLPTIEPIVLTLAPDLPEPQLHPNGLAAPSPLSATVLPIYGCDHEQQCIVDSVGTQAITTLIGLGGSGKTRLATEYVSSVAAQEHFNRVHWVSLREVEDPELLAPTIAAVIGVRFAPGQSLSAQLPTGEPTLIILDNFEHLIEQTDVVASLTEDNGAVRVLVTSRTPLGLPKESLVRLTGLGITDAKESPAEQLFASAARRAGADPSRLGEEQRDAVLRVCQRLGGHPLALELAGAWLPLLQPAEILDALSRGTEMLDNGSTGDVRSMSVVLDESWSTLPAAHTRTLMLLSTFVAGCATAEIVKMPELSITSIRQLVQRSMVSIQSEGRVELHPLIADYAEAQLAADPQLNEELRHIQSRWCQGHVIVATTATTAGGTHAKALATELPNIAAAWTWGTSEGQWDLHELSVAPLREFFAESGRVAEGAALLRPTIDTLATDPRQPDGLLAQMLEALGWLEVLAGRATQASELLDRALVECPASDAATRAQILRTMGLIHFQAGKTDEAVERFEQALAMLADDSASPLAGKLRHDLGQAYLFNGDRDGARMSFRAALDIGRATDDPLMMARSYLTLGHVETHDRPSRAVVMLEEGRAITDKHGLEHIGSYFPYALGLANLGLDAPQEAERFFTQGMEASTKVGHPIQVCANHIGRAKARLAAEDVPEALNDLRTATRLALETNCWPYMMWAAIVAARVGATADAAGELGLDLLSLAWHHPATHKETQDEGTTALAEIYNEVPEDCGDRAAAHGEIRLDEVAERILELLNPLGDTPLDLGDTALQRSVTG